MSVVFGAEFREGIARSVSKSTNPSRIREPFALAGDGIVLSIPLPSDAEAITEYCQDPQIQRFTTVPIPYGLPDAHYFIAEVCPKQWFEGGAQWAIRTKIGQETSLAGMIGLRPGADKCAEIGYWLAPHARGKGIASKAMSLTLDAAFDRLGLQCIEWRALAGNWDSWRLAWRHGFTKAGILRGAGQMRSTVGNSIKEQRTDVMIATLLKNDPRTPVSAWDGPDEKGLILPSQRDPEDLVRQFHEIYRLPIKTDGADVNGERMHMRMSLILEETMELVRAMYGTQAAEALNATIEKLRGMDSGSRDLVETADALADLVYVVYGMALEAGINLPAVLREVQLSNLSKLDENGQPIYREDGKVLKGKNFFPPKVAKALEENLQEKRLAFD